MEVSKNIFSAPERSALVLDMFRDTFFAASDLQVSMTLSWSDKVCRKGLHVWPNNWTVDIIVMYDWLVAFHLGGSLIWGIPMCAYTAIDCTIRQTRVALPTCRAWGKRLGKSEGARCLCWCSFYSCFRQHIVWQQRTKERRSRMKVYWFVLWGAGNDPWKHAVLLTCSSSGPHDRL